MALKHWYLGGRPFSGFACLPWLPVVAFYDIMRDQWHLCLWLGSSMYYLKRGWREGGWVPVSAIWKR